MAKKTNNERTGLSVPKTPKSPLSKADREGLNQKRVTANVANGHGKAQLRPEQRPDGPQKPDRDATAQYAEKSGHWEPLGEFQDKQPRAAGGHYLTVEELAPSMGEAGGLAGQRRPVTVSKTTVSPVKSAQHSYDTSKGLGQEDNG